MLLFRHILTPAIVKSPAAGDYITAQCVNALKDKGIEVVPPYMIKSKEFVRPDEPASWKTHIFPKVTSSWHNYMVKVSMSNHF